MKNFKEFLQEARGHFWKKRSDDGKYQGIVETNLSNPVSVSILSLDGQTIEHTNKFYIIDVKRKYYNEAKAALYFKQDEKSRTVYNALIGLNNPNVPSYYEKINEKTLKELEKLKVVRLFKVTSLEEGFKILILKLKYSGTFAESLLGRPYQLQKSDNKLGTANIIYKESLRDSTKEDILKLLKKAKKVLESHNMGKIFTGPILVHNLSSRIMGLYYPATKDVHIDTKAKNTPDILHTIIHEFGHKYWYEFMNTETRNIISKKFMEIRYNPEIGKTNINLKTEFDIELAKVKAKLKVGDTIEYTGRKKWKSFSPFKIASFFDNGNKVKLESISTPKFYIQGSISGFLSGDYKHQGKVLSAKTTANKESTFKDFWIPSEYSRKNIEEWYSEMFAYYLLDMFKTPEIKNWMKTTLK